MYSGFDCFLSLQSLVVDVLIDEKFLCNPKSETDQCVSDKNTRRYLNSEINRQGGPRPIQGEIGTVGDDEDAHQLWWRWCCSVLLRTDRREDKKRTLPKERRRERESGVGATGALTELPFKMGMGVDGGPLSVPRLNGLFKCVHKP